MLHRGHKKLSKDFEKEINKIMVDKKELEANIESIIQNEKLAKKAQNVANKLKDDLADKLKSTLSAKQNINKHISTPKTSR